MYSVEMLVHRHLSLLLLLVTVLFLSACIPLRLAFTPGELRAEFATRTAGQDVAPLIVPHEITAEQAETARQAVSRAFRASSRAEALKNALFNPRYFGIQYTVAASTPAFETLARQKGNCLAIAAAYVGLARAVGLRAFYLDVSDSVHEVEDEDQIITRSGHVTAAVDTETGMSALDFGGRLWPYAQYRTMDDLEATAHFHNNRGYSAIRRAQRKGQPIPWEESA
jgi:hypothetical protein